MGNDLSVISPSGINLGEERKAAGTLVLVGTSYLGKLQASLANAVLMAIDNAEAADQAGDKFVGMNVDEAAKVALLPGEKLSDAVEKVAEERNNLVIKATVDAFKSTEKAKVMLRRAMLAKYLRTNEDFQYLDGVTEDEKVYMRDLFKRRRMSTSLPKSQMVSAIEDITKKFDKLRRGIIDRLAKSAKETDEALHQSGATATVVDAQVTDTVPETAGVS